MKVKLRYRCLKSGRKSLYLDYYWQGKREREFLNLSLSDDKERNKEILEYATQIKNQRENQLISGEYQLKTKAKAINLIDILNLKKGANFSFIKKQLIKFRGEVIYCKKIDGSFINGFREYLLTGAGLKQNSARQYFGVFKQIVRELIDKNLIQENILRFFKPIKFHKHQRIYLEIPDLQKLSNLKDLEHRDAEYLRMFLFCCFTGIRYNDAVHLKLKNIEDGFLKIIMRKTKEPLSIPLNRTAENLLTSNKLYDFDGFLFDVERKYKASSLANFYLKKLCKLAGITKPVNWHTSRHTFAVVSIYTGSDIYTVSKLLGHTDVKTTQVYSQLIDSKKVEAVNRLDGVI